MSKALLRRLWRAWNTPYLGHRFERDSGNARSDQWVTLRKSDLKKILERANIYE